MSDDAVGGDTDVDRHDTAEELDDDAVGGGADVDRHGDTAEELDGESTFDMCTFPRFAQLLETTAEHATMTGFRFSAQSFSLSSHCSNLELQAAKLRAAPVVLEFAERLHSHDAWLEEDLERASRIVLSESVRNAVVASCRRLSLWPPQRPPPGVDESDCSYEDMSASLDVIAQRAFNDELRRKRSEGRSSGVALARRALTASYIVDFGNSVGVPLPPVPQTFRDMITELDIRVAEWEGRNDGSDVSTAQFNLVAFADSIRELGGSSNSELEEDVEGAGPGGDHARVRYVLVIDSVAASDIGLPESSSAYVEAKLGSYIQRTGRQRAGSAGTGEFGFEGNELEFAYEEQSDVTVSVKTLGAVAFTRRWDALVGEASMPLGPELRDCRVRKMVLPITRASEHVGVISFRLFLREHYDAPRTTISGPIRIASGMLDVVGEAAGQVSSIEGVAIAANLSRRKGYGTCPLCDAYVVIVTEEGSGRCFYYPYVCQADADAYFDSMSWKLISRIMFRCSGGVIIDEIRQGGLPLPYRTIRRAAESLSAEESR